MSDILNKPNEKIVLPPKPVDAEAKVTVSEDKMRAYIRINPPENGGKEVSLGLIYSELNKSKVTFGLIKDAMFNIIKDHIYGKDVMIAKGIEPVNGVDGSYKLLFDINIVGKPKEIEDGKVDYKNLDLVKNVEKMQPLCIISLPTEGKNGTTVYGVTIKAKKGKAVRSMTGKNTILSEDGKVILAAIRGHVSYINGRINVNDILYIKEDVDNATGNIRTNSNVVVMGTVLSGFSVESDGDIQINGTISGAIVRAGNNIVLKNGIIGGRLECEGNLFATFIENCNVFVKGSVKADYILNSSVVCGNNIEAIGSKAKIVGGRLIAGENITARTIGTISYTKTYLEIGTDPNLVKKQQEIINMIPDLEAKIISLKSLLNLFKQLENANRITEEKHQAYIDTIYSYKSYTSQLNDCRQELKEITESVKKKGYGKVICTGTIYPGTIIKIGEFKKFVKLPIVNKKLLYTEEGISEAL